MLSAGFCEGGMVKMKIKWIYDTTPLTVYNVILAKILSVVHGISKN